MDKQILVTEIKKMLTSFKNQDKCFTFVSIEPVYPNLTDSTYILNVFAPWVNEISCYDAIDLIIKKMHKTISKQYQSYISRVHIYENENDIMPHCEGVIEIENRIGNGECV
jgi:hypothetical protein